MKVRYNAAVRQHRGWGHQGDSYYKLLERLLPKRPSRFKPAYIARISRSLTSRLRRMRKGITNFAETTQLRPYQLDLEHNLKLIGQGHTVVMGSGPMIDQIPRDSELGRKLFIDSPQGTLILRSLEDGPIAGPGPQVIIIDDEGITPEELERLKRALLD